MSSEFGLLLFMWASLATIIALFLWRDCCSYRDLHERDTVFVNQVMRDRYEAELQLVNLKRERDQHKEGEV